MTGNYYIVTLGKTQTIAKIVDRKGNGWIGTNVLTGKPLYFASCRRLNNPVRDERIILHITGKAR